MKQIDFDPEDPDEEGEAPEVSELDCDTKESAGEVLNIRRATWREIEKRRELLALSRMIDENIDDRIFND